MGSKTDSSPSRLLLSDRVWTGRKQDCEDQVARDHGETRKQILTKFTAALSSLICNNARISDGINERLMRISWGQAEGSRSGIRRVWDYFNILYK